ncbi:hypothetical protein [Achromobacter spanius]|uniref:Uncharacterized protein n=1 Tax=Achromobacter spanius TaxID=217203 RepID=A0AA42IXA1_9BURK|nr:hypothetical protein [Achromobacter spanius]MDH0736401.1 hypothetical protein [Achromobacter spanius]
MSQNNDIVKRLPRSLLFGAKRFTRGQLTRENLPTEAVEVQATLGVRRLNEQCIELEPYGNQVRSGYAMAIGFLFVFGTGISVFMWSFIPAPITAEIWLMLFLGPWLAAASGVTWYLFTRLYLGKFRGGFIRIHRGTGKLYFVTPRDEQLLTLDWAQLTALAGYIPVIGAGGYTSFYPLYLTGIDWESSPPREICIACGNLGWRDDGHSAKLLWDYLQVFMEDGTKFLSIPPPIPSRLSRKKTFFRFYQDWADKFRRDLSTPKGKRWAALLIPAKIIWLIFIVFPDSLAEFIEYNVPYTSFPKEIDALCGFNEKRLPIMRLNGERIDS